MNKSWGVSSVMEWSLMGAARGSEVKEANCSVASLAKTDVLASPRSSHLAIFDLIKLHSMTDDTP